MAFDEGLADRIRDVLASRDGVSERRMFGGIAFMLDGNMAVGVIGEELKSGLRRQPAAENARPLDPPRRPGSFRNWVISVAN